jgi:hypothetical protein
MPLPAVWGPFAWTLLHGIGYKAGKCKSQKLKADENREALWLLNHLEFMIPCPECRLHIVQYRKKYGLPHGSSQVGEWLWRFHEAVNKRLGKIPGPPFTSELGIEVVIWKQWLEYLDCVKGSFQVGHLQQSEVKEWNRHLHMWLACF